MSTSVNVNGVQQDIQADAGRSLLDVLRNELSLTGSHFGCGDGLCGACMVLVDQRPVYACDTPLWAVAGKHVITIEGIADLPIGPRVQEAFVHHGAAQCGYCTSGMVVSAVGLLLREASPDGPEIRKEMDRNLCRCGTQLRVVRAIQEAASPTDRGPTS